MRKLKFNVLIFFGIALILNSCSAFHSTKGISNKTIQTYAKLLEESEGFLNSEKKNYFTDSLQNYIKECKDYDFYNHTRMEPYVCQPILVNKDHNKAIIMVLSRTLDLSNNRVEYIKFVSAKFENNKWMFIVKKGHSETIGYYKNYPTLSDTDIGIDMLTRLIAYKVVKEDFSNNESLFNSEFYVFK